MKVREEHFRPEGLCGKARFVRVRELAEGEEIPPGAEAVPDDAEVHGWERAEAPEA